MHNCLSQVDEDDKSDVDEDDMEMMAEAAAQNKAAEDKKHKSVRVSVAGKDITVTDCHGPDVPLMVSSNAAPALLSGQVQEITRTSVGITDGMLLVTLLYLCRS